MKKVIACVLWGTLLAAGLAHAEPAPQDHAGFIKSVRGKVQLQGNADPATTRVARAGDAIAPTDRIVTDADSAASLVLRDGTAVTVGPSSQLDIKEFRFNSTTQDGNMLM
jgi:hypothetical protein